MKGECNYYRNHIPLALMSELSGDQLHSLEGHLAECAPCAEEHRLYTATIRQLGQAGDVEVPRHFFVYDDKWPSLRELFLNLSLTWKTSLAITMLAVLAVCILALASLQVGYDAGSITVRLGKPSPAAVRPVTPAVDTAALKTELVRMLEERSRNERVELMRQFRAELERSETALTRSQKALLGAALASLESRMNSSILQTASNIETDMRRSMSYMYSEMETRRTEDVSRINDRLNRLAVNGEIKSKETDQILETLLQVAEFRLK